MVTYEALRLDKIASLGERGDGSTCIGQTSVSTRRYPRNQAWLVNGFVRFARRMMRKQFHALAVHELYVKELRLPPENSVDCVRQSSRMVGSHHGGLLRAECFPDRLLYAPSMPSSATVQDSKPNGILWTGIELTERCQRISRDESGYPGHSQHFYLVDSRRTIYRCSDRTTELMPGLAHLASSTPHLVAIPLAIEYCFWEERLPEALAMFGRPLIVDQETPTSKIEWNNRLKLRLRETQDELAERSIHRKTEEFRILLTAHGASWSWFNGFRRLGALLRGQKFRAEHGQKLKPPQSPHDRLCLCTTAIRVATLLDDVEEPSDLSDGACSRDPGCVPSTWGERHHSSPQRSQGVTGCTRSLESLGTSSLRSHRGR